VYALTTYCRTLKRTIRHLQERLNPVGRAFNDADSGFLRKALYELLTQWHKKPVVLNRHLAELQALRMRHVYGVY
jgi:hypothetical protein